MKKANWPLIVGGAIIGLLIIVMLCPSLFTSINPYGVQLSTINHGAGGAIGVEVPPYPPSNKYLLGSDMSGRDIYSLVIYGTRLTLTLGFLVVIGRFLLAIPLGIMAGFGNRICRTIINQFSIIFSAIPILLISFVVLNMPFFSNFYIRESVIGFTVVLTIVGFGKLGQIIEERTLDILNKPFIKGEIAIGKSKKRIAIENVIPHLSAEVLVLFFMEFATVLSLIIALGVFNVFVGNVRIEGDNGILYSVFFEPEWASMLGAARSSILSSPWIIIPPAVAFAIAIFGLNVFAEGLRRLLQNRNSKFITNIRRSLSFEKKDIRLASLDPIRGRFRLISIIIIGVISYTIVMNIADIKYNFASRNVAYNVNYKSVISGSKEAEKVSTIIAEELKKSGFKPISNQGYVTPYELEEQYYCYYSKVSLEGNKKSHTLVYGKDFATGSFGNYNLHGEIFDSTSLDLFSIEDYSKFNNKIVLINGNIYSQNAMLEIADKITKNSSANGILFLMKKGNKLPEMFGNTVLKYPLLWITQEALDKVKTSEMSYLSAEIRSEKLSGKGRNIIGILPGSDNMMKGKAIMLGFSYNYLNGDEKTGKEKMKFSLEMLKKLGSTKRDRAIIVAFWDGTLNDRSNGKIYYSKNTIYDPSHVELYLDLTKLNANKSSYVYYNDALSPATRFLAWNFGHSLKNGLKKNTEVINFDNIRETKEALENGPNDDEAMYYNGSMPVIVVADEVDTTINKKQSNKTLTMDDIGKIVFKTIQKNTY